MNGSLLLDGSPGCLLDLTVAAFGPPTSTR